MEFREIFEAIERYAARVHLLVWIGSGFGALVSAVAAHSAGIPWPLVALTALGGFVAVLFILMFAVWLWLRLLDHPPRFQSLALYLPFGTVPILNAARYAYSSVEDKPFGKLVFNWDASDDSRLSLVITHLYLNVKIYGKNRYLIGRV